jgi:hypothetical protein
MTNRSRKDSPLESVVQPQQEVRRAIESDVQPSAKVAELIQHVKDEIKEIDAVLDWNRKLCVGTRYGDSKLRVVRQVYSDQVLTWLEQLRDKVKQIEHEAKCDAAG